MSALTAAHRANEALERKAANRSAEGAVEVLQAVLIGAAMALAKRKSISLAELLYQAADDQVSTHQKTLPPEREGQ